MNEKPYIEISKELNSTTPHYLYKYLKDNKYEKVGPGIYLSKDEFQDSAYILHLRCPKGVISHEEALSYHGLLERAPMTCGITIYSGYNAKKLTSSGYKVYYVKKELLDMGKIEVSDFFGNIIPMYNLERTIVDLVRNRSSFEMQEYLYALKEYNMRKDKNLLKLYTYAEAFHVDKIIQKILMYIDI